MVIGVASETGRTRPRVWVETLWLLESLDSAAPLREISLQCGLNLILSEPMEGSPGHGVGKTAFCQLLRFVLEDPQWAAGTPLRDELCSAMSNGAVAARVHVDGEAWTVLKPWQHQKRYRAAREATWQQLASNEIVNEHDAYVQALDEKLVKILPVQHLPGSHQPIQWQHLLAWCSRDQGSRYQSYYHWRIEGTGFTLPAKSPVLVMKIALGLLKDSSLHDELNSKESELSQLRSEIASLERRPINLLAYVKHKLSTFLGVDECSPFRSASLFEETSLRGLAQQQINECVESLERLQVQRNNVEQERLAALEERAPLLSRKKTVENRAAQLQASIDGNIKEVERLRKEPEALQVGLAQLCVPGNRLMRECDYVRGRIDVVQLNSIRDAAERQRKNEEYKLELIQQQRLLQELNEKLSPFNARVTSLAESLNEDKNRELELLGRKKR